MIQILYHYEVAKFKILICAWWELVPNVDRLINPLNRFFHRDNPFLTFSKAVSEWASHRYLQVTHVVLPGVRMVLGRGPKILVPK